MLTKCWQNVVKMLSFAKCCQNVCQMLAKCWQNVSKMLAKCCQNVVFFVELKNCEILYVMYVLKILDKCCGINVGKMLAKCWQTVCKILSFAKCWPSCISSLPYAQASARQAGLV